LNGFAPTDLGTAPGTNSQANGINGAGVVVGDVWGGPAGLQRAVVWNGISATPLGNPQSTRTSALAINDTGLIVGLTETTPGESHATVWSQLVATDLGTVGGKSSIANALNATGKIVGQSKRGGDDAWVAALWEDAGPLDLNSLSDASGSGWLLKRATGINDLGWITGEAVRFGRTHAFLLTPVPEPEAFVLFAAGLFVVSFAKRRHSSRPTV